MISTCVLVGRIAELPAKIEEGQYKGEYGMVIEVDRPFMNMDGSLTKDHFFVRLWRGIAEQCCDTCTLDSIVAIRGRLESMNKEGFACSVIAEKVSFIYCKTEG